jgi:maltooligosyltrehalose trehalohydrolase
MGQEFGASSPFQFFTDHTPELGKLVTQGRRKEFQAFSQFADPHTRERIPDPQAESTFFNSKLRLDEASRTPGSDISALYQRLLNLRGSDPVLSVQDRQAMEAKALSPQVLAVRRWRTMAPHEGKESLAERLLLVNFGATDARVDDFGGTWRPLLESGGQPKVDGDGLTAPARSATIFARDPA